ncbi:MAG: bifunctional [glutamate--ammonia ligase]-adenylyl-L-tyrosine phosphorylase/[glutamate--ammonia-ligase] adenylyltransferase, partial [Steroidobacteraceae bacterium]|nr:bifunctional [glutamate--ammonia ligase]-adenylyl-L-tyrosine phosphorylase/[glutamate--ammonia-ligase] adenylyltransferase [Steroidobacteraceae bacterium]
MTARLARAALERALAASEFLQRALQADPALFDESPEALGPCPEPRPDEQDAVIGWLRRWRRRHFAQIAARDIGGAATVEQTLQALSDVADEAVRTAYRHAWAATAARYGVPRGAAGEELPMVVVAMGKLGGSELNFSSDIDLVFLFPEAGETTGAAPVSHDEFYVRLGQSLIHLLAASTADGFAFRVDMRLRPFGDSGPLACSFASFEDYLLQQGRDWERYAWIKARAIVGARHYATLFAQAVRPFVFRRYLDYGVFESLREMKALIEKQVARRELHDDLKLGPGGIREIEFIVQALQLIRGGQDVRLQSPRLLEVLPLLARSRLLGSDAVGELRAAYLHLRLLENRLQMLRDAQTHRLPEDAASRAMLLAGLALQRWEELTAALEAHRAAVRRHFDALVFAPAQSAGAAARPEVAALLLQASGADDAASGLDAGLQSLGFAAAGDAARLLQAYRDGARVRRLDEPGRRRLQALLDALLPAIGRVPADEQLVLLRRVVQILEAIGQRSSYFALLNENASARARLLQVCRAGEFLAQQLEAFPLLLDELLDERLFARPP